MPYSDPEKRRAYGREWMKRNADKARGAMRRWRERHPDAHRAENAAYYARHAERLKRRIEGYHRANPLDREHPSRVPSLQREEAPNVGGSVPRVTFGLVAP